jgi:hypothetical protein
MEKDNETLIQKWLSNFNSEAFVEYNNRKYRMTESELKSIYSTLHYWHHKTDPGSWLSEALVRKAKIKFSGKLPRDVVISLCAQLLHVTAEKLESTLDWNANYMAWHDGGTPEDHHVWLK